MFTCMPSIDSCMHLIKLFSTGIPKFIFFFFFLYVYLFLTVKLLKRCNRFHQFNITFNLMTIFRTMRAGREMSERRWQQRDLASNQKISWICKRSFLLWFIFKSFICRNQVSLYYVELYIKCSYWLKLESTAPNFGRSVSTQCLVCMHKCLCHGLENDHIGLKPVVRN